MKKRLLTTINLSLFIGLVSLSPSLSYGVRPTTLKQIEGAVGRQLTPLELGGVDALYVQARQSIHTTAQLILEQELGQIDRHHRIMRGFDVAEIRRLEGLLHNANAQIQDLTAANRRLAVNADEAIRLSQELIRMLRQEQADHERTTQRLLETREELRRVRGEYLGYMVQAQRQIQDLRENLAQARGENAELRGAIAQLQVQLEISQRNYEEASTALIRIKNAFDLQGHLTAAQIPEGVIGLFQRELRNAGRLRDYYAEVSRSNNEILGQRQADLEALGAAFARSEALIKDLRRQEVALSDQETQIRKLLKGKIEDEVQIRNLWVELEKTLHAKPELEKNVADLTLAIRGIAHKLGINPASPAGPASPQTPRRGNVPGPALGTSPVPQRTLGAQLGAAGGGKSPITGLYRAKRSEGTPGSARGLEPFNPGDEEAL